MRLWYEEAAKRWEEVLPLGNGSLGVMIWGTVGREQIGLNLDSLWSGYPRDTNNHDAKKYLEPVREKIFQAEYGQAAQLLEKHLLGEFTESYLFMGNLHTEVNGGETEKVTAYRRELSLDEAVARISYEQNAISYHREYFVSYPNQVFIMKYKASKPMSLQISFDSEIQHTVEVNGDKLTIKGQCPEHVEPSYITSQNPIIQGTRGIKFETHIQVQDTDGVVFAKGDTLVIQDAEYVVLAVQACSEKEMKTAKREQTQIPYLQLLKNHIKDYKALYDRVTLYLGEEPEVPTDKRLEALRKGEREDTALYALFFQYGRYLLIASSREGSEAANLQGIWNWEMRAPWCANYTTNINLEMNYWPSQVCDLAECLEPYFRLLQELAVNGKETARIHFGCRGFCMGHNTDYWRLTNPVGAVFGQSEGVEGSSLYAFFVLSAQWLCAELWKAYEYHLDVPFLRDIAYPLLKESALFAVDWLVEYKGQYVTCPSTSPENKFRTQEGTSPVSMATTIDMTIIRETFEHYKKTYEELCRLGELPKESSEITGAEIYELVKEREARLYPFQIGEDGRLLEWFQDFEETEKGHRHISHAYGLFPGELFERDTRLKEACRRSLEYRVQHGCEHTGWSCGWIANLFAVLEDKERAFHYLKTLLTQSTESNLWTSHPPFQIDANFAGIMAMANMLVQDRNGKLKILPALPDEWKNGYVKGLRLKGNKKIDIEWKEGEEPKIFVYETDAAVSKEEK